MKKIISLFQALFIGSIVGCSSKAETPAGGSEETERMVNKHQKKLK